MILKRKKITKVVSCLLTCCVQYRVKGFKKITWTQRVRVQHVSGACRAHVRVVGESETGTPLFGAVSVLHSIYHNKKAREQP